MEVADSLYPEVPEVLDRFSLDITDEWNEGAGFSADILCGEVQFSAENEGNGQRNRYFAHTEKGKALFREFSECSRTAYPHSSEPEDLAVLWLEIRAVADKREKLAQ